MQLKITSVSCGCKSFTQQDVRKLQHVYNLYPQGLESYGRDTDLIVEPIDGKNDQTIQTDAITINAIKGFPM